MAITVPPLLYSPTIAQTAQALSAPNRRLLAFVDDLAKVYADLWAAGRLDEIRDEEP
jgi:hypothetical protein